MRVLFFLLSTFFTNGFTRTSNSQRYRSGKLRYSGSEEFNKKLDEVNNKIDWTAKEFREDIKEQRTFIGSTAKEFRGNLEKLDGKVDSTAKELSGKIDSTAKEFRGDLEKLSSTVQELRVDIKDAKSKSAADDIKNMIAYAVLVGIIVFVKDPTDISKVLDFLPK